MQTELYNPNPTGLALNQVLGCSKWAWFRFSLKQNVWKRWIQKIKCLLLDFWYCPWISGTLPAANYDCPFFVPYPQLSQEIVWFSFVIFREFKDRSLDCFQALKGFEGFGSGDTLRNSNQAICWGLKRSLIGLILPWQTLQNFGGCAWVFLLLFILDIKQARMSSYPDLNQPFRASKKPGYHVNDRGRIGREDCW